eukprot:scaffold262637_cov49-Attheya_sp.AAC.3
MVGLLSATSLTTGTILLEARRRSAYALMGIPKMFRWLTDQYPISINWRLMSEGLASKEYRDVDIIHPCTHGNNEEELVALEETAMFRKIFLYVDKIDGQAGAAQAGLVFGRRWSHAPGQYEQAAQSPLPILQGSRTAPIQLIWSPRAK